MKLNLNALIIIAAIATLGLTTACGDDGCEPAAEEACQCERTDGTFRDGYRVCNAELKEWTDCVCAFRSVRLCNVVTIATDNNNTIENLECSLELEGDADTVTYTAVTGECDQPTGSFCRPLPTGATLSASMTCVQADDPTVVFSDWENLDFNLHLGTDPIDYGFVFDVDPTGLPTVQIVDYPAENVLDSSIIYETCEDYEVPTFDELEALSLAQP